MKGLGYVLELNIHSVQATISLL